MKGDKKVLEYLGRGLRSEMTAINQYWLHARLLTDWGILKMGEKWLEETAEERAHAQKFIDRILFLGGTPDMQTLDKLRIGKSVKSILENDLKAEHEARDLYQEAAAYCYSVKDYPSKAIFEQLMADEEGHIDFLETQLELIERIGEALYTQSHIGGLGD